METRQVLLICLQPLLGEGLQRIFQRLDDIELVQLACTDLLAVEQVLALGQPDVVVIAGELGEEPADHLLSMLLSRCIEIPVIWVNLEDSQLHVYSSRTLPANSAGLVNTIRQMTTGQIPHKKIPPNMHGGDRYDI